MSCHRRRKIMCDESERIKTVIVKGIEFCADPKMEKQMENDFVESYSNGRIRYSKDFYMAMHRAIEKGMTYAEAYRSLGFDLKILGIDRASSAGKRAEQMAREGKLNYVDPGSYDGSVPREKMPGDMTPEEELAYLKARNHYLETLHEAKKKFLSEYAEKLSTSTAKKPKTNSH
jgi:hypothetical protein